MGVSRRMIRDEHGELVPGPWRAQVRIAGVGSKSKDFEKERDAIEWYKATWTEMNRGELVDNTRAKKETFGDLIEAFIKDVVDYRPGEESRKAERSRLQRFMRDEPQLCKMRVAYLRPRDFREWMKRRLTQTAQRGKPGGRGQYKPQIDFQPKLRKDGQPRKNAAKAKAPPKEPKLISPGTVKRELTVLEGIFAFYMEELGLKSNPVNRKQVKRPVVDDERDERITDEQHEKLVSELQKTKNQFIAPLAEFARVTAARQGNLLRLKWSDVDLEGKKMLLRRVKNSRSPNKIRNVLIPLTERAREILAELPKPEEGQDGLVFPVTVDSRKSAWNRARVKAGVPSFRFHDERHERPTIMSALGFDIAKIKKQTGHADTKSVMRYINHGPEKIAEEMDAILAGKMTPEKQAMFDHLKGIMDEAAKLVAELKEKKADESV